MKHEEIKGLKCDNPECDYVDMTILRKDYPLYIDFPCPKCGRSLLTQEDYDAVLLLEKLAKNPIVKFFSLFSKKATVVNFHGKGFENMEVKEVNKKDVHD